jgi:hypothetical protein
MLLLLCAAGPAWTLAPKHPGRAPDMMPGPGQRDSLQALLEQCHQSCANQNHCHFNSLFPLHVQVSMTIHSNLLCQTSPAQDLRCVDDLAANINNRLGRYRQGAHPVATHHRGTRLMLSRIQHASNLPVMLLSCHSQGRTEYVVSTFAYPEGVSTAGGSPVRGPPGTRRLTKKVADLNTWCCVCGAALYLYSLCV